MLAMYIVLLAITALIYIPLPIVTIAIAIYKVFQSEWMVASLMSCISIFTFLTSEWYFNLFIDQYLFVKQTILEINE